MKLALAGLQDDAMKTDWLVCERTPGMVRAVICEVCAWRLVFG